MSQVSNDQHDKMSSIVPRSALYDCPIWPLFKPLMALFSLLQPCTGALFKREPSVIEKQAKYQNYQHDETSSMVPRSAPYDHPVQSLFKPLMAPFSLLQSHTGAPFKGDLSVIERQARYHNDQDNELSSLVPISAPYDCPVWAPFKPLMAPFKPLMAPFKIPLQPVMVPFKGDNFPM